MDLAMSALPSEADIRASLQDVCFVPTGDIIPASDFSGMVTIGLRGGFGITRDHEQSLERQRGSCY